MTDATVQLAPTGRPRADEFIAYGSELHFQLCRGTVRTVDSEERVILYIPAGVDGVLPAPGALAATKTEALGEIPALVRESSEGRVSVQVEPEIESQIFAIAATAAVMRASWAWDESHEIMVVVNQTSVRVAVSFTGADWRAVNITDAAI